MSLGRNIARLRQKENMTQLELARKAGINNNYLSRIEEGNCPRPHVKTIARIATALGVSIDDLGL